MSFFETITPWDASVLQSIQGIKCASLSIVDENQPFRPWMEMPSTRFFWKKKKRTNIGTSDAADMAKVAP